MSACGFCMSCVLHSSFILSSYRQRGRSATEEERNEHWKDIASKAPNKILESRKPFEERFSALSDCRKEQIVASGQV